MVGTPHRAILPWTRYCRIDPLGLNQNARWTDLPLATGLTGQLRKRSVQQSPVSRPVHSDHSTGHRSHRVPVTTRYLVPGAPVTHWSILPWARYCIIDHLGLNQNARRTDLILGTGLTSQLRKGQFSSHRSADRYTLNILPVTPGTGHDPVPGAPVTPVRPVSTGQKAQKVQANQCLDQSELLVLNSPVRTVQLEQNVHESLGNKPSMQDKHTSEHSQAFQGLLNSDSPDDRDQPGRPGAPVTQVIFK